jgi:hypothetical protein
LEISSALDESILLDNLNRIYSQIDIGSKIDRALTKQTSVAYLSLLLQLADAQEIAEGTTIRTDNIKAWMEYCGDRGHDLSQFVASVEIMGKNGQVDRVYFPIPDLVNKYWTFPGLEL